MHYLFVYCFILFHFILLCIIFYMSHANPSHQQDIHHPSASAKIINSPSDKQATSATVSEVSIRTVFV